MDANVRRTLRSKDDRIILQFDYDCFYAQVVENKNPSLKSKPLGIRQKNILATCNYNARRLGVRKLMLASEAKRLCPDLILVDGEDLTPFRDVSKVLFNFLRTHSSNNRVERLGFDEVFMDVTDLVDHNMLCLNRSALEDSFFHLSKEDPLLGFQCDLTSVPGCVEGKAHRADAADETAFLRLVLGSHLGNYLRTRLESEFGYTSTCGISTNKLLSKLVGAKHKPRNQTTLLALRDEDVSEFMDGHALRAIPGIGFKIASILELHVTEKQETTTPGSSELVVTAKHTRQHPSISPASLEKLLGGPGAEKGIGVKIWGLLHGVDRSEVKEVADFPTQISIEDTYKRLDTFKQITDELHKLSLSLIRRMRVDLLVADDQDGSTGEHKWIAKPRTIRLTIRSWPKSGEYPAHSVGRISRSGALPSFVFDTVVDMERLAGRLVSESLLPLLRRFGHDKNHHWNLQLINICAANMVAGADRDISTMFRKQDEALRPWKISSHSDEGCEIVEDSDHDDPEAISSWESSGESACPRCGHFIPTFALTAHNRYHELEG